MMMSGQTETFQLSPNISEVLFFSDFKKDSGPDKKNTVGWVTDTAEL